MCAFWGTQNDAQKGLIKIALSEWVMNSEDFLKSSRWWKKLLFEHHSWQVYWTSSLETTRLHREHQPSKWSYHRVYIRVMKIMTLKSKLHNEVQNEHLINGFQVTTWSLPYDATNTD